MTTDGAFVLGHEDVALLLHRVGLYNFLKELKTEIEKTYNDDSIDSIRRTGWPHTPDTLEVMGCQGSDLTCVKLISSNPTIAGSTPDIPTVAGTLICTAENSDQAKLVCDAGLLTSLRTSVGTAVVVDALGLQPGRVGVIGTGLEGRTHALVLSMFFPSIREIVLCDKVSEHERSAEREINELWPELVKDRPCPSMTQAQGSTVSTLSADVVVTATYATGAVIRARKELKNGILIAAIGADLPSKRELDYSVYDKARFVADDWCQCLREGELQHVVSRIRRGLWDGASPKSREEAARCATVGDLLNGDQDFLDGPFPYIVYDSSGFAGQDLAVGRVVLRHLEGLNWSKKAWNASGSISLSNLMVNQKRHRRVLSTVESMRRRSA